MLEWMSLSLQASFLVNDNKMYDWNEDAKEWKEINPSE